MEEEMLSAHPYFRNVSVWPRKVRSLLEAMIATFKFAFVIGRQRAQYSPSSTERTLAELSKAQERIRTLERINDILWSRMERLEPEKRPNYLPEERFWILLLMQWNLWSAKETANFFLISHSAVCRWIRVWRGRSESTLFFGKPPWNRFSDGVRDLVHHLREICPEPEVGYRTIANWIMKAGITLSASSAWRFLKEKRKPKRPSSTAASASNESPSVRSFNILDPRKPNRTWHLDISTIRVLWLSFHVAALIDGFSRKLLGVRVYRSEPKSREMARLVRRAYKMHGRPRFIVTDHGGQFRDAFRKRVEDDDTEVIKGKVRSCKFNGKCERFFKTMKLWQRVTFIFASVVGVKKHLEIFRAWYNEERVHQAIDGLTPEEAWSGSKRLKPRAYLASDHLQPFFIAERVSYANDAHLPVVRIKAIQEMRRVA